MVGVFAGHLEELQCTGCAAPLPMGELAALLKYLIAASACLASQWAANRAGNAKRQQGGVRNKTKDRASLERSERPGFCFVGKSYSLCSVILLILEGCWLVLIMSDMSRYLSVTS